MILLNVSNSSELIASKVGEFVERLTPQVLDHSAVEDQIITKLRESLKAEGIKGEISCVQGVSINEENLVLEKGFKVRKYEKF